MIPSGRLAVNQTHDGFGCAAHIRDRKKCKHGRDRPPVMNAFSQRGTKSTRRPILVKVTTALTTKTIKALMRTGKINLPLPSIEFLWRMLLVERSQARSSTTTPRHVTARNLLIQEPETLSGTSIGNAIQLRGCEAYRGGFTTTTIHCGQRTHTRSIDHSGFVLRAIPSPPPPKP